MSDKQQDIINNKILKENTKQGRCGSCGKKWEIRACIEEELCNLANRGFFSLDKDVKALGVIFDKLAGDDLNGS